MPKPDPGNARYLTNAEAEATGLTCGCIVFHSHGGLMLLLKTGTVWLEMVKDYDWLVEQLDKLWSGHEPKRLHQDSSKT